MSSATTSKSKTVFTVRRPFISSLCRPLRKKVLMHSCLPHVKVSFPVADGLFQRPHREAGTGWNTAATRAGSGCSAQRPTASGIKSHTFFLSLGKPALRGHSGSLEKKQKQCCLPEVTAASGSRLEPSARTQDAVGARTGVSHRPQRGGLECIPATQTPPARPWLPGCVDPEKVKVKIPSANSDSRPRGKQWTDLPTFNCLICNQTSYPSGSQPCLPRIILIKSQHPGTTTGDSDLVGLGEAQAQVHSEVAFWLLSAARAKNHCPHPWS